MRSITEITDDPKQKLTITLDDNRTFTLEMEFIEQQQQWNMNIKNIPDSDLEINSVRVGAMPNLLRQWARVIPFGIIVATENNDDPYAIDDFSNGRAVLSILNEEEVEEVETLILTP